MTKDEQAIVDLTNGERRKAGKKPVKPNAVLFSVARQHADDMMTSGKLEHRLNGKNSSDRVQAAGYNWVAVSENIAWNHRTVDDVVSGWMKSEGHRVNLLGNDVTEIGVGIASNAAGEPYWVQVFAKPDPEHPNIAIPVGPGAPPRPDPRGPIQAVKFTLHNLSASDFFIDVHTEKAYTIKPGESVEFSVRVLAMKAPVEVRSGSTTLDFVARHGLTYTLNISAGDLELIQKNPNPNTK